jgi:aminopeptidase
VTVEKAGTVFDLETLADKTIDLLSVQPGQVIWIWTSTLSLDLVGALAYRIRQRGAFWTLRLIMESLLHRIGRDVAEPYLALVPEHELRWLDDIDAIVEVRDHSGFLPDVPLSRRRAMGAEWIALIDEAARRGCRRVHVLNPTPALAAAYGISLEALRQRIWSAVNVDHRSLDDQQELVGARLARAGTVHVTCPLGTDLRLRIEGRPVHLDTDGIPRGEVYVAPLEDSAEGVAFVEKAFIKGRVVEHLRLTFSQGRVMRAQALDSGAVDSFWELLAASSGDKDAIAEFAIGLNPGVTEPVGDVALDEKIGGSVHIAIGMNDHFGGRNRSNLHLDLVIMRPTVWLDSEQAIVDGVLLA